MSAGCGLYDERGGMQRIAAKRWQSASLGRSGCPSAAQCPRSFCHRRCNCHRMQSARRQYRANDQFLLIGFTESAACLVVARSALKLLRGISRYPPLLHQCVEPAAASLGGGFRWAAGADIRSTGLGDGGWFSAKTEAGCRPFRMRALCGLSHWRSYGSYCQVDRFCGIRRGSPGVLRR